MDKKYDKKEKINFALKKENTICSLFEVEKFLRSGTKIINLSLIHIPSPRDRTRSRMPSSA